ncbi:tail fiber/spike domain-containing protein [Hafnia paralvei]|uniref:tail fiber/spike domain-containing protein n=1 Tax=Hafnia paralvei TaxID=546367 RepID=UPI001CC8F940|nr:glycosyl hydrolase family 28-related protein [Hafnia paralvei]UBM42641.1 phage tail protein [Hafnia paralvei]
MATTPTQDAVPSESPRDLKFNAGKIDEFVTSSGWTYTDRFGNKHYTIEGINYLAQQVMNSFGYVTLTGVSFTTGATVTKPNEVLFNEANNEYYKWTGSFSSGPKVVPANSTPESTGGIGAGKWLSVGDSTLRGELAAEGGAEMVGYGQTTVKGALDELNQANSGLYDKDGFNLVGRFLNLSELRSKVPAAAGQIVYVASAASATATEKHYGGGYFQSFDNSTSPIADDGGIVIVPATGTLAWRRINFTEYDMCFWGVKPDGVTDNASVITKACDYARENKAKLLMPSGVVKSSESLNIYSETAIIGSGKNKTTFKKTTNNGFPITGGPTIDALVVFVPNKYDHDSTDMSSFCFLPRLEGMTLTRENLTDSNMNYYGLWLDKSAMPIIKDIRTEGAYIGLEGTNSFGVNIESTQIIGLYGKGNIGFLLSNYVSPNFWLSGTSVSARLLSVVNYQIGFEIDGLQYSSFDCCTAEGIIPLTGTSEQKSYAFRFINPYCISMTSCATEGVKGTQVQAILQSNVSFKASLKIENYLAIDQINPIVPMKYMEFDSGNVGALSIQIIGGDLSRDNTLTNLLQTTASGTNCVVCNVGSWIDGVTTSGGADYRTI